MFVLAFSLILAACSDSTSNDGDDDDKDTADATEEGANEDGSITYAVDQAPEGLFIDGFAGSAIDSQINDFIHESMTMVNADMEYEPNLATWETDDNKVYTFTIEEGVKWHNGEELTMEDWKFAIEVIAHPDYNGPRYNYVEHIEGAAEFKAGEADEVSGFEIVDPYTAVITFVEPRVNNLENLWTKPMPKAHLEHLEVAEMDESPEVRENPVGLGPFKVAEIQPGEYYSLERFDDYW